MSTEAQTAHDGWGRRWISGLERLATSWQSRLPRGRDYAQKGHVVSLAVTPGKITARVQGSRSKPYTTSIDVPTFKDTEWSELSAHLARESRYAAELLLGALPEGIEQLLGTRGANLFPVRNSEMIGTCNCPDKARPCKHIAAVHYAFGEALDRDPFLLLRLRGADRRDLLRGLRRTWYGGADDVGGDEDDAAEQRGMSIHPRGADGFNRSPHPIEQMSFSMREGEQPLVLLQRLGAPTSWQIPVPITALLGPVYEDAARRALEIALAEPPREDPATWLDDEDLADDEWSDDDDDDIDDDLDDDEAAEAADSDVDADADELPPVPPLASAAAPSPYRTLEFGAPALPAYVPTAAPALPKAAPAPFLLPRSISRPVAPVVPDEAGDEGADTGGVLIRKGVASLSRSRRRQRTTGSLKAVTGANESIREHVVTGSFPTPQAQEAVGPVRRRVAGADAAPAAGAGPVVRRRAGGDGPTARDRARTLERDARAALDAGDFDAALEAALGAWNAEPTEPRYLLLMASADQVGSQRVLVQELSNALVDASPDRLCCAQILLLLTAGRYQLVSDWIDGSREGVWATESGCGEVLVPFALVAAVDGAELRRGSALAQAWDRVVARGAKSFPDLKEPPAPVGAWLDFALQDNPPSADDRARLLNLAAGLVIDLLGTDSVTSGEADPRQTARWVVAVVESLRLADRDAEVPAFAAVARRAASGAARVARAVETELLDADVE